MLLSSPSVQRMHNGKEALVSGDLSHALKELTVSLSLKPTIEAYLARAEAAYNSGKLQIALNDVYNAHELCKKSPADAGWLPQVVAARNRYEGAVEKRNDPPVDQTISVLLPTTLKDKNDFVTRAVKLPDMSSAGITLTRRGGPVCDLDFWGTQDKMAESMLYLREHDPLSPDIAQFLSEQPFFLGISAPNTAIASEVSQISLAMNFLKLLVPLMYALEAPVMLVANAELVLTRDRLAEIIKKLSKEDLINGYAKVYKTGRDMFSAGMHALGYPDVQIPFSLVDIEVATDVIQEFLLFEVTNEIWKETAPLQFRSAVTGLTYHVELQSCTRYLIEGDMRINPKGVWTFTKRRVNPTFVP